MDKQSIILGQYGEEMIQKGLADVRKCDIMTVEEYRAEMEDNISSDEDIKKHIGYLEVFLRNIIKAHIKYCINNPIKK